ncbi:MAG: 2-C-methyl-D-erythritol 2,4-cyclodiphosphate synthase [Nitrospirae bacterium]|nr:2-C-methyl-D-erythritol 2,4-cyclodiphosphate synthase [Nitrospirota bacterium]
MRIGIGYDSHRLVEGRRLIIGGVEIPFEKGLQGHSDADVLCHAIIDALIGALGMGDIGRHFPDTDDKWKGASSIDLLSEAVKMVRHGGFEVAWIDSTVIIQEPKIGPFIDAMKNNISGAGISAGAINIKAKTNEGMGFIGKGEGVVAQAACLLKQVRYQF